MRNPDVSTRLTENGAVIYDPDTYREYVVNETGLTIWKHLNTSPDLKSVVSTIRQVYDTGDEETVSGEIQSFLLELYRFGFVKAADDVQGIPGDDPDNFPFTTDSPVAFDISLTRECNLACPYCFYDHIMEQRQDLDLDTWRRYFSLFKSLAVRSVSLTGGEVFTRKDIWEIIDSIIECRMRYGILTNGTLIDEQVINRFSDGKRLDRLDSIQVSIDGSCPDIHDRIRGPGSFEKAVRGLRLLVDNGFSTTVRVTINRFNVTDLDRIAEFLLDDIGLPNFSTNDASPIGAGCDNRFHIGLLPEQKLAAMETLHSLNGRYHNRITATAGPVALWKVYADMEKARATGVLATDRVMGYLSACGCVFNRLAVHHDGTITPCHMLPELVIGHLGRDLIPDLWKNHPVLNAMRARRTIKMADVPECADCTWNAFCNGSCPAVPYQLTGDFNRGNMHDCYRLFLTQTGGKKPWVNSK